MRLELSASFLRFFYAINEKFSLQRIYLKNGHVIAHKNFIIATNLLCAGHDVTISKPTRFILVLTGKKAIGWFIVNGSHCWEGTDLTAYFDGFFKRFRITKESITASFPHLIARWASFLAACNEICIKIYNDEFHSFFQHSFAYRSITFSKRIDATDVT